MATRSLKPPNHEETDMAKAKKTNQKSATKTTKARSPPSSPRRRSPRPPSPPATPSRSASAPWTMDEICRYAKIDRVANVMRPYMESLV